MTSASFQYKKRRYTCLYVTKNNVRELRIRNDRGEVLVVQQGNPIGVRERNQQRIEEVDVRQPNFFDVIRMAVMSLEVQQKEILLLEKEKALQNTQDQLLTLKEQIKILSTQKSQQSLASEEMASRLLALQQQAEAQELHNQKLQQRIQALSNSQEEVSVEAIEEYFKKTLGKKVWQALQPATHRDLITAHRNRKRADASGFGEFFSDYKEVGVRLSSVVEREVIGVFFPHFYAYLETNSTWEVLSLCKSFTKKGKETLGDLPRLLSDRWYTFNDDILTLEAPNTEEWNSLFWDRNLSIEENSRYQTVRPILQTFLRTWEHPLSPWLQNTVTAASTIDKIRKLRNLASHSEPFYRWQFMELWLLIVGGKTKQGRAEKGLLREVYENEF